MKTKCVYGLLILVLAFSESGCATRGFINATLSDNQREIYKTGKKSVVSMKENVVIVTPLEEKFKSNQKGAFLITVKNGSNNEFEFSTDNVFAKYNDRIWNEDIVLKVYSYEDLVKEEKKRQTWAAVAAAIQGVSDSMQAHNTGYTNNYGNLTNGSSVYGNYSTNTFNYAAAQAAQRQANENSNARFASIELEGQLNMQELSSTILKKETLFPNVWSGGIVKMQMPTVTDTLGIFTITIVADNEQHVFNFNFSNKK